MTLVSQTTDSRFNRAVLVLDSKVRLGTAGFNATQCESAFLLNDFYTAFGDVFCGFLLHRSLLLLNGYGSLKSLLVLPIDQLLHTEGFKLFLGNLGNKPVCHSHHPLIAVGFNLVLCDLGLQEVSDCLLDILCLPCLASSHIRSHLVFYSDMQLVNGRCHLVHTRNSLTKHRSDRGGLRSPLSLCLQACHKFLQSRHSVLPHRFFLLCLFLFFLKHFLTGTKKIFYLCHRFGHIHIKA